MAKDHRGRPSDTNKDGTGIPAGKYVDDNKRDEELTNNYTNGEDEIASNIRQNNPNRNTDKDDATNAGGYKN